ncbi:MAG: O-antigen ligase family protein, partial [Flavobacteriaceae bacterium]|nr:O-antigen ligase family protein [Flavobacteriaceae bacterium]
MKINTLSIDYFILWLLSFVVLVDMINGFFVMEIDKFPISQGFKLILLILFGFRLLGTKDLLFAILLLVILQIGPVMGLIKTGDLNGFISDIVFSTKWFMVPFSYFYFKRLLKGVNFALVREKIAKVVTRSYFFVGLNLLLGFAGLGMAFYNHGYQNALGTRGFIYAGNELTILVLALAYLMAIFTFQKKAYKIYILLFLSFLLFSFLITSKTVLGGVLIVFLIPILSNFKLQIKRKWLDGIAIILFVGLPTLIFLFWYGIMKSGVVDKIRYSMIRNENDILTVILSNRNNFVQKGWKVFAEDFNWAGKFFGYGQQLHLKLSGHTAEVDFFSMLFASGIIGILCLLLLLLYWGLNARQLSMIGHYPFARSTFLFLWFIIIAANLSGHVLGSGIAGIFLG